MESFPEQASNLAEGLEEAAQAEVVRRFANKYPDNPLAQEISRELIGVGASAADLIDIEQGKLRPDSITPEDIAKVNNFRGYFDKVKEFLTPEELENLVKGE